MTTEQHEKVNLLSMEEKTSAEKTSASTSKDAEDGILDEGDPDFTKEPPVPPTSGNMGNRRDYPKLNLIANVISNDYQDSPDSDGDILAVLDQSPEIVEEVTDVAAHRFTPYVHIFDMLRFSELMPDVFVRNRQVILRVVEMEPLPSTLAFFNQYLFTIAIQHGSAHWTIKRRTRHIISLHSQLKLFRAKLKLPAATSLERERRQSMRNQMKTCALPSSAREDLQPESVRKGGKKIVKLPRKALQRMDSSSLEEVESYLSNLLHHPLLRSHCAVLEFFEISPVSFIAELGPKLKEGFVKKRSGGRNALACCGGRYKNRWLALRESCLFLLSPGSGNIRTVMLVDSAFQVSHGFRHTRIPKGLLISNLSRSLVLRCDGDESEKEWSAAVDHLRSNYGSEFVRQHRHESFAPVRKKSNARWYVDGSWYMSDVADLLESAKDEIFITDWWLSPDIYMKRPDLTGKEWKLSEVLDRQAARGVKIFILLYKEVELALGLNSFYSKRSLSQLSTNIKVLRHPDHYNTGTLYWAHHEKIIVIDQMYAFVGGIDLCYGRWDDYRHKLVDVGHAGLVHKRPSGGFGLGHLIQNTHHMFLTTAPPSAASSENKLEASDRTSQKAHSVEILCADESVHSRDVVDRRNIVTDDTLVSVVSNESNCMESNNYLVKDLVIENKELVSNYSLTEDLCKTNLENLSDKDIPLSYSDDIPASPDMNKTEPIRQQNWKEPVSSKYSSGMSSSEFSSGSDCDKRSDKSCSDINDADNDKNKENCITETSKSNKITSDGDFGTSSSDSGEDGNPEGCTGTPCTSDDREKALELGMQKSGRINLNLKAVRNLGIDLVEEVREKGIRWKESRLRRTGSFDSEINIRPSGDSGDSDAETAPQGRTKRLHRKIQRRLRARDKATRRRKMGNAHYVTGSLADLHKDLAYEESTSVHMWVGKDYVNWITKDLYDPHIPFNDNVDRHKTPRMPWHDIALYVEGPAARDAARHFILRWNAVKSEKVKHNENYPYLIPKTYQPSSFIPSALALKHKVKCQVLRSTGQWSGGISETERSIYNCYADAIKCAKHYIYIENQFFITSTGGNKHEVLNSVGYHIFERILRAHRNQETFRVYVVLPLLPAFEGQIGTPSGVAMQYILHYTYQSIVSGPSSLIGMLTSFKVPWQSYLSFCSLRTHDALEGELVSELIYVHSKLMIVDDNLVISGSANINDRSLLGDRDSEVDLVIEDEEFVKGQMNGKVYRRGVFAGSLRMYLFGEHLGLTASQSDINVSDPVSNEFFLKTWQAIASKNTKLYDECAEIYAQIIDQRHFGSSVLQFMKHGITQTDERLFAKMTAAKERGRLLRLRRCGRAAIHHDVEVFNCVPCDSVTTFAELKQLRSKISLAKRNRDEAKKQLEKIQGRLVLYPLLFLKDEVLKPGPNNKEFLLPVQMWV